MAAADLPGRECVGSDAQRLCFVEKTEGYCEDLPGGESITTAAGCTEAAHALGLATQNTNSPHARNTASHWPKGCQWHTAHNKFLSFNVHANAAACQHGRVCVCKVNTNY